MHPTDLRRTGGLLLLAALMMASSVPDAAAGITGLTGTTFTLTAKPDRISTPDGGSYLFWGLASGGGRAQYPAPTLILTAGDTVTVTLKNELPTDAGGATHNVSLVFPGQDHVTAACVGGSCTGGALTLEALPGGTVSYTFTAARPGTFVYHSGTRPDLQVEMGITGAIVVRPAGAVNTAYGDPASAFDREYLFFLSEIDPRIHDAIELGGVASLTPTDFLSDYFSNYWFVNGRSAPDTMNTVMALFPTQPYDSMPRMHPGERLLMRVAGGGSQFHPFHHHGNHARIIARDGRPLETWPGAKDLSYEVFTIQSGPGQTYDAIFEWTGKGLGWDMYGHTSASGVVCTPDAQGYDLVTKEWCADHLRPFPIAMPDNLNLVFGGWWSGSPFLGAMGTLPPGEGGLNPNAGYAYMWHSHTEKELTNFDVFPGGMFTMLIIEPPGTTIPYAPAPRPAASPAPSVTLSGTGDASPTR